MFEDAVLIIKLVVIATPYRNWTYHPPLCCIFVREWKCVQNHNILFQGGGKEPRRQCVGNIRRRGGKISCINILFSSCDLTWTLGWAGHWAHLMYDNCWSCALPSSWLICHINNRKLNIWIDQFVAEWIQYEEETCDKRQRSIRPFWLFPSVCAHSIGHSLPFLNSKF